MYEAEKMKIAWLRTAFVGAFTLLCTVPALTVAAQNLSPCDKVVVASAVGKLLKEKFPQWRPKQLSDIDKDDQKLWLEGPNGESCPGIAIGHFESSDSLSYAFLLVPKSDSTGGHKIVVFSKGKEKDAYSWSLLDHAEGQTYSGLVISRAEPGKYKDWEGKKSIQIKLDALNVEWIEKGAQLYYWSAGRYHKLQVSD